MQLVVLFIAKLHERLAFCSKLEFLTEFLNGILKLDGICNGNEVNPNLLRMCNSTCRDPAQALVQPHQQLNAVEAVSAAAWVVAVVETHSSCLMKHKRMICWSKERMQTKEHFDSIVQRANHHLLLWCLESLDGTIELTLAQPKSKGSALQIYRK